MSIPLLICFFNPINRMPMLFVIFPFLRIISDGNESVARLSIDLFKFSTRVIQRVIEFRKRGVVCRVFKER